MLTAATLRPLLSGGFGQALQVYDELPSTQDAARAAAARGAAEGAVFIAESQTQGRGRHGHAWHSPPGAGLYLSVVLRPRLPPAQMLPLTLAFGLAVADAVIETCGLEPELRWPNDLLAGGKKFCGLLLETNPDYAVLGVGINIARQVLPPDLEPMATTLEALLPAPVPRPQFCAAVLAHIERRYDGFGPHVLAEFERRSRYARGLEVTVGKELRGTTDGLDESGFLRVRRPDGTVALVTNGDVRPA